MDRHPEPELIYGWMEASIYLSIYTYLHVACARTFEGSNWSLNNLPTDASKPMEWNDITFLFFFFFLTWHGLYWCDVYLPWFSFSSISKAIHDLPQIGLIWSDDLIWFFFLLYSVQHSTCMIYLGIHNTSYYTIPYSLPFPSHPIHSRPLLDWLDFGYLVFIFIFRF